MNFDQRLVKLMGIVIAGNGDLGLSSVHRETNIPLKVVLQRLKESRVCRAQVVFKKGRGRERDREREFPSLKFNRAFGSLLLIDGQRRIVIHLRDAQGRTVMDS